MDAYTQAYSPMSKEKPLSQSHPSFYDAFYSLSFGTYSNIPPASAGEIHDFITILEICQSLNIDFLPTSWQPALDSLGVGGQVEVRQSPVNAAMSLAFNRVKLPNLAEDAEMTLYRALSSQLRVLSHPELRYHPNIVFLLGVSWDVKAQNETWVEQHNNVEADPQKVRDDRQWQEARSSKWKVWPVLVYEKASHGDLIHFMQSEAGKRLHIENKLELCWNIGQGLISMHSHRILHMDIKPQNMLIFEEEPKRFTAKVSDLGFSIQLITNEVYVTTPQSAPWNAPEWHHREHKFPEIAKMDVFSYGMLCLWLLFRRECSDQGVSFDIPGQCQINRLNGLKHENQLLNIAVDITKQSALVPRDAKTFLTSLFRLCLASNPDDRAFNINHLFRCLYGGASKGAIEDFDDGKVLAIQSNRLFSISDRLADFYYTDYRVRSYIALCLQHRVYQGRCSHAPDGTTFRNDTLQLAVCYKLGFGVPQDHEQAQRVLQAGGIPPDRLSSELKAIRHDGELSYSPSFAKLFKVGHLGDMNWAKFYHEHNLLEDATLQLTEDVRSLTHEFNASIHIVQVVQRYLADIYYLTGSWNNAENLELQVLESRKRLLGDEHSRTLTSMANLASIYFHQNRVEEASRLQAQATRMKSRFVGAEDVDLLNAKSNLAEIYRSQGRLSEAERLQRHILETRTKVLGAEHPHTLESILGLSVVYVRQKRWERAEYLQAHLIRKSVKALGASNLFTLSCMGHIMTTYRNQERWDEAIRFGDWVMKIRLKKLGIKHEDTLLTTMELAMIYRSVGRHSEALSMISDVFMVSRRFLGAEHTITWAARKYLRNWLSS